MIIDKDHILRVIWAGAVARLRDLSNQYVAALPEQKEAIQAGIEIERWLADGCRESLQ